MIHRSPDKGRTSRWWPVMRGSPPSRPDLLQGGGDQPTVGGHGDAVDEHARRAAHSTSGCAHRHVCGPVEIPVLADAPCEARVHSKREAELDELCVGETAAALLG